MRKLRSKLQIIFQDPYASLNPKMRISAILGEALQHARPGQGAGPARARASPNCSTSSACAPEHAHRFPHEFSGGQRQRIGIARALAVEPEFIVADEPLSALDVSIQAQVINLLADLRERLSLTMLFISHDLDVVEYLCDRVVVLYLGRVMEVAPTAELFERPLHPYTQALLAASPKPDPLIESTAVPLTGRHPEPDDSAVGLRVPHPLPARHRRLRADPAPARRDQSRPLLGLHSKRPPDHRFAMNQSDLLDPIIGPGFKGFPLGHRALRRSEVGQAGWNVLAGDLPLPIALLKRDAVAHNLAWMQQQVRHWGIDLAPHGKTTMSPQLFTRQLEAGAWGLTFATVTQLAVGVAAGARRTLIANQVLADADLAAIQQLLRTHADLRIVFLVDSPAQLALIEAWAVAKPRQRALRGAARDGPCRRPHRLPHARRGRRAGACACTRARR